MVDPEKDPWQARHEVAERLRRLASSIDDTRINEDIFHYGDFDKGYRGRVIRSLKTMDAMVNSFVGIVEQLLKWRLK